MNVEQICVGCGNPFTPKDVETNVLHISGKSMRAVFYLCDDCIDQAAHEYEPPLELEIVLQQKNVLVSAFDTHEG